MVARHGTARMFDSILAVSLLIIFIGSVQYVVATTPEQLEQKNGGGRGRMSKEEEEELVAGVHHTYIGSSRSVDTPPTTGLIVE